MFQPDGLSVEVAKLDNELLMKARSLVLHWDRASKGRHDTRPRLVVIRSFSAGHDMAVSDEKRATLAILHEEAGCATCYLSRGAQALDELRAVVGDLHDVRAHAVHAVIPHHGASVVEAGSFTKWCSNERF
ncbi:hypothetical protein [Terrabacter aeriphilus]|uniref:hypothetical protein n=1 Tax=Terrabacter aeriphilus TaxID=515662 RepID=UPI0031EADF40